MSAAEIIDELPKLTEAERRAIRHKLVEFAAQNEEIGLCDRAALEGAMLLDRMEDEDAPRERAVSVAYDLSAPTDGTSALARTLDICWAGRLGRYWCEGLSAGCHGD